MRARDFTPWDYNDVCEWWNSWGWPVIPPSFLPENGVIIEEEGKSICCAWIYKTDTPICWIEYYVCRKDAEKETRAKALDMLVSECAKRAKEMGFQLAFSSINHNGLGKRLEAGGFVQTDERMTNYLKVL